jgi:hypothetical protein
MKWWEAVLLEHVNIGNLLNRIINDAQHNLFSQGELAQLTFGAFDSAASNVRNGPHDSITITFPVGFRANKETIDGTKEYNRDDLVRQYEFLALHTLPLNGIVQLVTIVEALLMDVVRLVVLKYPKKLGGKRQVGLETILQASTLEEIQIRATDALIHELSYESPSGFSDSMQKLLSIDLQNCPAFHRYVELKATRDIYIHARGVANEVYVKKAGSHSRVKAAEALPIHIGYFLESYEACIQLTEWLEGELHQLWHSDELEDRRKLTKTSKQPAEPAADLVGPASPSPPLLPSKQKKQKRKSG